MAGIPTHTPNRATSRALACLDIADGIVQFLHPTPDSPLDTASARGLLNIALASKTFLNPALNVLWRHLNSPSHLLCTIPRISRKIDDERGTPYYQPNGTLREGDLTRFDFYSRKVRSIRYSRMVPVHPIVVLQLRQLRPNGCFPGLRDVLLSGHGVASLYTCPFLPVLIPKSLHSLKIEDPYYRGDRGDGEADPFGFLINMEPQMHNLQSLSVSFPLTREALDTILALCPNLVSLASSAPTTCDLASAWTAITSFPKLANLTCAFNPSADSNHLVQPLQVPHLQSLTWEHANWTTMSYFFRNISTPNLSSLTFHPKEDYATELLFPSGHPMSPQLPSLREFTIQLKDQFTYHQHRQVFLPGLLNFLQPLHLTSLKVDRILWNHPVDDLWTSIASTPTTRANVTTLHLSGNQGSHRPSIFALMSIAEHFPALEELSINLHRKTPVTNIEGAIAEAVKTRKPSHPLQRLNLGSALAQNESEDHYSSARVSIDAIGTAFAMGRLIDTIFPRISDMQHTAAIVDQAFWQAVFEARKAFRRIRLEKL